MESRPRRGSYIFFGHYFLILVNNIIVGITSQIPKKGWKDIALRIKDRVAKDHLSIVSAGTAFYFFLAIFPTLAAGLLIYVLLMEPAQVEQHMSLLANILAEREHQMISNVLERQSEEPKSTLGWRLALSILISLWSVNKGVKAVFEGVNMTYDETNRRGFFKLTGVTLLFTIGGIIIGSIAIAMVVAFPALINKIGLPATLETIIQFLRWPILALIGTFSLAVVYKVAPCRQSPEFKWISWGAIIATVVWVLGSWLFNLYVSNFDRFDAIYGSFAAVIILMLWFYLTAFAVLLGAEINSEMEHQTSRDTTTGEDKRIGPRGGHHTDHAAEDDKENNKGR